MLFSFALSIAVIKKITVAIPMASIHLAHFGINWDLGEFSLCVVDVLSVTVRVRRSRKCVRVAIPSPV